MISSHSVISIRGDGIAARACARLFNRFGIAACFEPSNRPRVPALLIGDASQALVADVFENAGLFEGAKRIERRIVAWGAEPVELPHSAVVIGERELEDRLAVHERTPGLSDESNVDWTIFAARGLAPTDDLGFGSRTAIVERVRTKRDDTCCIEAVDSGWLFLLPGWLLAIGVPLTEIFQKSKLVAPQIEAVEAATARLQCYPHIQMPLTGSDWLACGSAAMTFDPICGDGAGNAIREAILATAVIRAGGTEEMLAHYRARLIAGFARHLELCRPFYAAIDGEWWRAELAEIDRGLIWCREQLHGHTYRYQLRGFDLEPVMSASTISS